MTSNLLEELKIQVHIELCTVSNLSINKYVYLSLIPVNELTRHETNLDNFQASQNDILSNIKVTLPNNLCTLLLII